MARDKAATEQIGVARSTDGLSFERLHGDGLIVPVDAAIEWKSLRTCNPTVLQVDGRFVMFYQGIAARPPHHIAIGIARSADGVDFRCEPDPCVTFDRVRDFDPGVGADGRTGVLEPSVLFEAARYRMWFVCMSARCKGNDLLYAESTDLSRWTIQDRVLSGHQFGDFNLHYPQVIRGRAGYELWFSLRDNRSYVYGVFRMTSRDGLRWGHLQQLLPTADDGVRLPRRFLMNISIGSRELRAPHVLDHLYGRLFTRRNQSGMAHPHVMGTDGAGRTLYLHAYHSDRKQAVWMDIARATVQEDRVNRMRTVFRRSDDPDAWDGWFVADPFVCEVAARA